MRRVGVGVDGVVHCTHLDECVGADGRGLRVGQRRPARPAPALERAPDHRPLQRLLERRVRRVPLQVRVDGLELHRAGTVRGHAVAFGRLGGLGGFFLLRGGARGVRRVEARQPRLELRFRSHHRLQILFQSHHRLMRLGRLHNKSESGDKRSA